MADYWGRVLADAVPFQAQSSICIASESRVNAGRRTFADRRRVLCHPIGMMNPHFIE